MSSGWCLLQIVVLFSLVDLKCEAGQVQRTPGIKQWWERETANKKPAGSPGRYITAGFYYPYLCSVIFLLPSKLDQGHLTGDFVSTCTIFTKHWVLASVDNINRPAWPIAKGFPVIHYFHKLKELWVYYATVYGQPAETLDTFKKSKIHKIYFVTSLRFMNRFKQFDKYIAEYNYPEDHVDDKVNLTEWMFHNPLGGADFGVAFVKVLDSDGFIFDAFTLAAPMISSDNNIIRRKVEDHLKFLEEHTMSQTSCYVGTYDRISKKMKWFQVKYIRHSDCREVYCTYNNKACLEFPRKDVHVCFKSIIYGDTCPEDRGAAVYCHDFGHSIFAILTTAPNCGWKNLPNVYTLISVVADAYKKFCMSNEELTTYTTKELKKYTILPPHINRP